MYSQRVKIKHILQKNITGVNMVVMGWIKTFRSNQFIALNDGSSIHNFQIVVDLKQINEGILKRLTTGACIKAIGEIKPSLGKGQALEMLAEHIEILGDSDPEKFPLQPKKHSLEFLREIAHLRFRTNTFGAIFRIRHALAFAIHQFLNERGFYYLHSPIITASDAEGAGEMFQVTTLPLHDIPKTPNGTVDFGQDFFAQATNLTVSGQLEGELAALALGEVYTFGPTFRAENSNTARHLAEFWMIEPEMAFYDLEDNMNLAQDLLQYVLDYALKHCLDDLTFLDTRLQDEEKQKPAHERSTLGLIAKLQFCVQQPFERITYTEAIDILLQSDHHQKKKFTYPVSWGMDLQSEHERYLVEKHFQKPIILTNYPKAIKAFYMRQNEDGKTVRAMDVLFPGIGEIIGGSQREERLAYLENRIKEMSLPLKELNWYLDTRRFGSCVHSGFGLGFERLMLFVTGMTNIRDVIPFPRTPRSASF